MSREVKVLDHGYIKLIESYGSDEAIIEAARMSTGKGFLGWGHNCTDPKCMPVSLPGDINYCTTCDGSGYIKGDEKLLAYLYKNKHSTPFEMAGLVIEVQAPIFVFREWHRHRTQSYNEMSARYIPLPDINYIPSFDRIMINDNKNKQAQGLKELNAADANTWLNDIKDIYNKQEKLYQHALKNGIPKELARITIPVGRYSRMRASANLRNWLAFLNLRMAPNAQWEIRQYAIEIYSILAELYPRTMKLFKEEFNAKERTI